MSHKWFRALVMLTITGCATLGPPTEPKSPEPVVETRTTGSKELPPAQAALVCWNAGEEMRKTGYEKEAVAQYERVRELEPNRQRVAWRLAVLYDKLGDNVKALAEYQRALQAEPRNADLLNDAGYYHYQREDWDNAEKRFRDALAVNPKHARATVNLGLTLGHLGLLQGNQKYFEECNACFQRVLPPAHVHCNLGVLLAHHGRIEEARRAFAEALRLDATLVQARSLSQALEGKTVSGK